MILIRLFLCVFHVPYCLIILFSLDAILIDMFCFVNGTLCPYSSLIILLSRHDPIPHDVESLLSWLNNEVIIHTSLRITHVALSHTLTHVHRKTCVTL